MRSSHILVVAVASVLALSACAAEPAEGPAATPPASTSDTEGKTETSEDLEVVASDYLRLDGEDLLFGFDEYTVDSGHNYSAIIRRTCTPNQSGTDIFRAIGWMVDEDNNVILNDKGWVGYAHVSLPINDEAATKMDPWVQLELKEHGLVLTTDGTDPAAIEGTFTVDGATAIGDFMVPNQDGGPAQRVEFRVTCTEDD